MSMSFDIVSVSFAVVLVPYIMRYITEGDCSKAVDLFRNYLKIGYYSVFILTAGVLIVSNEIIPFLYSSEYLPGKNVFIIYIFDSMLKFASVHLVLAASGKTKTIMKYSIITLVSNVLLSILLFKTMGMIGPAISTLIVTTVYTLAILNQTKIILNTKWSEIFELKDIAEFLAGILAVGFISYLCKKSLLQTALPPTITMFFILGLFGTMNLLLFRNRIKIALKNINQLKLSN